jgi:hypothetical protein
MALGCLAAGWPASAQETQAVSREVTLYTRGAAGAAPATQAISREVTLYTRGAVDAVPATQAISREVTLFTRGSVNTLPATQAVSREMTAWVTITPPATLAVSREVTMRLGFTMGNVVGALRIAAGLSKSTALERNVFNIVTSPPSQTVVDLPDVVAIAEAAMAK